MKRILFAISFVLLSFSIFAQNKSVDNISRKVKSELKSIYPNAKSIKWSSHEEGVTDASFIIRGKRISVIFKADTLFVVRIEINKNELPKAVKNHLESYYINYSITKTYEIKPLSNSKDKNINYWIELGKGQLKTVIICHSDGNEMTAFYKHVNKKR